jgi:transketolase
MGLGDIAEKFRSFGWYVSCCDGHEVASLLEAFADRKAGIPHVIIADTVKGKGVSFIENRPEWHHHRLTQKEYEQAILEIRGEDK